MNAYKEQVRQEWTESAGPWGRWHARFAEQFSGVTELLVAAAAPTREMRALDLACGSGVPALPLARRVGSLVATDLVPDMVKIVADSARAQGLGNLTTQTADMEALPFEDAQFDLVTCRFGLMFCPDYGQALREIHRVLKPGGRAAFVVWAAPDQPFFNATSGVLMKLAQLPAPPPEAPSPFRFAKPGSLSDALSRAGFAQRDERTHEVSMPFHGTPAQMWEVYSDVQRAIFRRFEVALGPERYQDAVKQIRANLEAHFDGKSVNTPARIHVAWGVK